VEIPIAAPQIGDDEIAAVTAVLRSGALAQGPHVAGLERAWAAVAGTGHAIAVNSGTAAIHAALAALGVGPGDEVITVPFTFIGTVNTESDLRAKWPSSRGQAEESAQRLRKCY